MKYAVALGGGGARGAYQIGVFKALKEMDIEITTVLGTSVGAINAAAISLNQYEKAKKLWEQIDYSQIIHFNEANSKSRKNISIIDYLIEFTHNKGIDISPLKRLLNDFVDEEKLRNSAIEFGIVTASITDLKPYVLFENDIPKGQIVDYIIASAALPVFQKHEIDGKVFLDGAIYDSVPVAELIKRGHKNIIAIDISGIGLHKKYDKNKANVIYIKNSAYLGKMLEFSKVLVRKNMLMGYLDAKKAFNLNIGKNYYILTDEKRPIKPIDQKEIDFLFKPLKTSGEGNIKRQILRTLYKYIDGKLEGENVMLAAIEITAEVFDIERLSEYTYLELEQLIIDKYQQVKSSKHIPLNKMPKSLWDQKKVKFDKQTFSLMFTPYIFRKNEIPSLFMLVALPKYYIANLFIYITLLRKQKNI